MSVSQWWPLALVCLLGAMSPGPSLAIVVRHTVTSGTPAGVICAIAHGFGIFLWAALMVSGLGALLLAQPTWFDGLRALGAGFLLYLGCRALMARRGASANTLEGNSGSGKAAREGFVIALSNPKIAVFFAALFSQFIQPDATMRAQFMIATTAAVIDALWYTVVAVLLSQPAWSGRFMQHRRLLDHGFGVILIVLSAAVLWSIWQPI
ncbi:MAG: LysE family translocator [Luminiphilus sp.]|nr:LysE family translocator [Luminiphilus sp.]